MLPTVLRGPAEVAIILGIVYIAYYQAHGPFQYFFNISYYAFYYYIDRGT